MPAKSYHTGSLLKALLACWVTIIFGTSILIYIFSPLAFRVYHTNKFLNTGITVWEIADEMGPFVKLSIIFVFTVFVFLCRKAIAITPSVSYFIYILLAMLAVVLVLALLPAEFSRGYGVGLTGSRFDRQLIPVYLAGAGLGGLVFRGLYGRLSTLNAKAG